MSIILPLSDEFPLSSFGDLRTIDLMPIVGWTFNYNVNTDLFKPTTTGNGTVTQNNGMVALQTGATQNSSAKIETIKALRYTPGLGGLVRCTALFTPGVENSTQIIGIGDNVDGFFFGFNGSSFGILRRINQMDNWTPQTAWNLDKFDGTGPSRVTIDPTKGNVYSIQYQWLGYGTISFFIENPISGRQVLVHRIQYPNSNTIPSILNPTLPIMAEVINSTNTTNITLQSSSAMSFVEGNGNSAAVITRNAVSSTKIITTETSIVTIRNKDIYQSKTNRVQIRMDYISFSVDGTRSAIIRLVKNATLGGTPVFTDVSTDKSVMEFDTAGTTVSDGKTVLLIALGRVDSGQLVLGEIDIELSPDESLTISAASAASSEVSIAVSWQEMF
ncbi:hypothetical protein [Brevibacillus laterosporus]|uniref:hypothetical protein n=1 Tax=Brevibacillus laterosporus TaxID=1465 RepID=UPI0003B219F8|nr:hypothetical protein [Brevibacillus laterosporus]ERM16304.1 hypothetical protein P615_24190 [Brevibacillus laterosporus PE36]